MEFLQTFEDSITKVMAVALSGVLQLVCFGAALYILLVILGFVYAILSR